MKGYMIDIGITDRQYVAAAVQLLLDTILETNPDATLWLNLLANADSVDEHVEYAGAPSELLEEFRQTDMLGFVIMAGRGSAKASLISVWPPKCFGSKFPYWHVLANSHDGWGEPFLDRIIQLQGIHFAAISDDDTMDLHELDHVDENNFPWDHWLLVAARVTKQN
jgi:hypothetical protein